MLYKLCISKSKVAYQQVVNLINMKIINEIVEILFLLQSLQNPGWIAEQPVFPFLV